MTAVSRDIVLFDGICNLCNSSVQFIIRHDKHHQFRFASLQSEFGKLQLKKYEHIVVNTDSIIYICDETIYMQSTAVLKIAKQLTLPWKLFHVFIYIPQPMRDWIYAVIAKNRYSIWGKRDSCMVPTKEVMERFITDDLTPSEK